MLDDRGIKIIFNCTVSALYMFMLRYKAEKSIYIHLSNIFKSYVWHSYLWTSKNSNIYFDLCDWKWKINHNQSLKKNCVLCHRLQDLQNWKRQFSTR